jgi:membrane protease YdiL (CAAX protease family)
VTEEFLFRGVLQGWLERVALWTRRSRWENTAQAELPDDGAAPMAATRPLLVWPIVVSSLVFALMHYSHGVAWVPLFFFALALGYLFQRTGSLVAPIVLHVSLNASTMLILYLMSLGEPGA